MGRSVVWACVAFTCAVAKSAAVAAAPGPPGAKSRCAARTSARVARPSQVLPARRLEMATVSLLLLDADAGSGAPLEGGGVVDWAGCA
jgi:hypothetical protein